MLKLLWPLLTVNLRIPGFDNQQHILFKVTQLLPHLETLDELRPSCHAGRRRPTFGAKLEVWRHKMFHIFHFLMVLGIVNPFS